PTCLEEGHATSPACGALRPRSSRKGDATNSTTVREKQEGAITKSSSFGGPSGAARGRRFADRPSKADHCSRRPASAFRNGLKRADEAGWPASQPAARTSAVRAIGFFNPTQTSLKRCPTKHADRDGHAV